MFASQDTPESSQRKLGISDGSMGGTVGLGGKKDDEDTIGERSM